MASKNTASMLEHALEYARAGLAVIPLHSVLEDGACTCGAQPGRCSPGKHPRITDWRAQATTDETTISKWWSDRRWPNANIGGVCGDYMCLDIDARHDGFETLERLIKSNAPLPDTAVAETGEYDGQRGRHYWFKVPDGYNPSTRANVREGIDIRAEGGYAVLPPSPHSSGVNYSWIGDGIHEVVEAPEWVVELVPEHVVGDSKWAPDPNFRMSKQVKDFLKGSLEVPIGEQREFLTVAARSVLTTGRSVETTASLLWEGYDGNGGISNCDFEDEDPWTPEHIYAIVSDLYAKPPTSPLEKDFASEEFSLDDIGNAARLIASFQKGQVMFVPELKCWQVWNVDRKRFFLDTGPWMGARWGQIATELGRMAMKARTEGEASALQKHARNSRMKPRRDAAVSIASELVHVHEGALNADPFLFACDNGVIDLRDASLRDERPQDRITRRSPIAYNDRARSRLFEKFLKRVVPDDDLRDFLQIACGYSLTGSVDEHAFFYVYGRPASGKTTILEALKNVMGSYALTADTATFMRAGTRASSNAPTADIARLAGARFVVTHEVEKDERLATSLVSHMVGGEAITARILYGLPFEFFPKFKLWIGANNLPKVVGGARSGLWRRVKILPFDETIPKEDRDPTLARKLREPEAAVAILRWAVEGAARWHELYKAQRSMIEPEVVSQAAAAYQRDSDHIMVFAEDALERVKDERVPAAQVYEHYKRWCKLQGRDHPVMQVKLGRDLNDIGLVSKSAAFDGRVQRCYIDVRLKDLPNASGVMIKGARPKR